MKPSPKGLGSHLIALVLDYVFVILPILLFFTVICFPYTPDSISIFNILKNVIFLCFEVNKSHLSYLSNVKQKAKKNNNTNQQPSTVESVGTGITVCRDQIFIDT